MFNLLTAMQSLLQQRFLLMCLLLGGVITFVAGKLLRAALLRFIARSWASRDLALNSRAHHLLQFTAAHPFVVVATLLLILFAYEVRFAAHRFESVSKTFPRAVVKVVDQEGNALRGAAIKGKTFYGVGEGLTELGDEIEGNTNYFGMFSMLYRGSFRAKITHEGYHEGGVEFGWKDAGDARKVVMLIRALPPVPMLHGKVRWRESKKLVSDFMFGVQFGNRENELLFEDKMTSADLVIRGQRMVPFEQFDATMGRSGYAIEWQVSIEGRNGWELQEGPSSNYAVNSPEVRVAPTGNYCPKLYFGHPCSSIPNCFLRKDGGKRYGRIEGFFSDNSRLYDYDQRLNLTYFVQTNDCNSLSLVPDNSIHQFDF